MKAFWISVLSLGLFLLVSASGGAADYTFKDKSFKEQKLRALTPYGPGFNEEQRTIWNEFVRIAALYEDFDITDRIFELRDKADGIMSTQHSLDLFDICKNNPFFFIRAVDRYYSGNFRAFLSVWINETDEITVQQITLQRHFSVIPECLYRESRVFNIFWIPGQARNDEMVVPNAGFYQKVRCSNKD